MSALFMHLWGLQCQWSTRWESRPDVKWKEGGGRVVVVIAALIKLQRKDVPY